MTDAQRLNELISKLNMKPVDFARSLGYDRATIIYNILNGNNGISRNIVNKIVTVYTQVNPDWLLRGEGLMLKWQKSANDIDALRVSEPELEDYRTSIEESDKDKAIKTLWNKLQDIEKNGCSRCNEKDKQIKILLDIIAQMNERSAGYREDSLPDKIADTG